MDFTGTTTANAIAASVIEGVQTTGAALWPFLSFAGIPLAFIVGGYLVYFINRSIETPQKRARAYDLPSDVDPRDEKAYRRGRSIIEKEHPDFFD